ncbi:MAG: hypothetical protein F4X65_05285 [Chloroflexi bacterium]|nr:hypothetical protein [Chloroflexota bacterium]
MHVPEKISPTGLADYLDTMCKSVFQSGISWRVVESKWPGVREAMQGFEPEIVASLGEPELDELAQDSRMIRHRRKLSAICHNAQRMLDLAAEHGSFEAYLRSHGSFEATVQSIRKEFKYMGDAGTYHFLYTVGEDVPPYDVWCATHERKGR